MRQANMEAMTLSAGSSGPSGSTSSVFCVSMCTFVLLKYVYFCTTRGVKRAVRAN
jgi:hypothetical protein